ncbi:MAG: putative 4-mercaptohistidine N1-methyltransferase [Verrucomicrobiales bacterium]|nr:putative 4-mercaptohistidine N1-methyltransferase [Verrucomicrobiales bacterium]
MSDFYESDQALSEYLLFHYGDPDLQMPWTHGPLAATDFPVRCVETALDSYPLPADARALELGCAVGRAAFELSRSCARIIALDRSAAFIAAARRLQSHGRIDFTIPVEGPLTQRTTARTPVGSFPERIQFEVGDALHLPADLGTFDLVLAANLLDRLPDPVRFLSNVESLVKPEGRLLLTSPYTWLETYTPRPSWLCADGRRTSEVLHSLLPGFRLLRRVDLPFVIREHARKFQWSVAEATLWQRCSPA